MIELDKEELMKYMPHRDPMLLVDRTRMDDDGNAESEYTIPDDPYYTHGHFPGFPIVPGVILCEIMAQGSVLLFGERLIGKLALYAGMDKVRFKKSAHPGDKVIVKAKIISNRDMFVAVEAKATIDGELCASGQLSFMLIDRN